MPLPADITVADLIPEAMKQAYGNCRRPVDIFKEPGTPRLRLGLDLEMSRFLPVRRFLDGEIGRFEDLADKIENLYSPKRRKIDEAVFAPAPPDPPGRGHHAGLRRWLKSAASTFPNTGSSSDFNQAARYVQGLASETPAFRRLVFAGDLEAAAPSPFQAGSYNKILMSLVLSYIFNPVETLRELRRIIASRRPPGPVEHASGHRRLGPVHPAPGQDRGHAGGGLPPELAENRSSSIRSGRSSTTPRPWSISKRRERSISSIRKSSTILLEEAGWESVRTIPSFGDPPQGYVVMAKVREPNG